jgi:DNA (cytosine-5)-methyltransferase 1
MQLISLFSGIGGFELASEWMGWDNVVSCEINPFGQRVLKYYWPDAYHHDDIHTLTYEKIKEQSRWDESKTTILVGGFPCQPYSAAGKRLGKEDDRHLWPQMLRIIREVKPAYVVGENVFGLVNWSGGLVFEEVQADLEAEGYEVQPYILPAASVGAPHRRDRVWFIAYANHEGGGARLGQVQSSDGEIPERHDNAKLGNASNGLTPDTNYQRRQQYNIATKSSEKERITGGNNESAAYTESNGNIRTLRQMEGKDDVFGQSEKFKQDYTGSGLHGSFGVTPDTENARQQTRFKGSGEKQSWGGSEPMGAKQWGRFPTQPPVCGRNDGFSSRLVGITFSKHRNESIKAYGNAIVPQVVYQIFKAIQQYEDEYK